MKPIFIWEDFDFKGMYNPNETADIANEKINKLIESWPILWTSEDIRNKHPMDKDTFWNIRETSSPRYKARLAFIEEIVKEPCKHEPVFKDFTPLCRYCGVELVSEWKEKR